MAAGEPSAITSAAYSIGLKNGNPITENIGGTMKTKPNARDVFVFLLSL
jgi:hypothetical protein